MGYCLQFTPATTEYCFRWLFSGHDVLICHFPISLASQAVMSAEPDQALS
jgi:hypothetical protein